MALTFFRLVFRPRMSRHAAPMQNRVLPFSLAVRAADSTVSTGDIFVATSPVLYREDCAQYEQSSLHPPVLMFISVHIWMARGSWKARWIVAWFC